MTSEFLLDAIGQLDDELVLAAATPVRRTIPWAKAVGWAAAIAVCIGIARIPGVLPFSGANSGAAAPESDMILGDVMLDADKKEDDYEYRSEQESQVREPSATAGSKENTKTEATDGAQGIFEPRFFTERGVYLPIVPPSQAKLPDTNVKELGELVVSVPGEQVYPSTGTQELVGCPVWESEGGEYLYIQLPDGLWLTARLVK